MPGLDPNLVAHALNVEPRVKPVIQPMRTFHRIVAREKPTRCTSKGIC